MAICDGRMNQTWLGINPGLATIGWAFVSEALGLHLLIFLAAGQLNLSTQFRMLS